MVNGKSVPACTLMIHEHPQASFDYKVSMDNEKGAATVTLTNKTPNPGSFKFTWTFDDGTTSNEVNAVKVFDMRQFPRGRNTVITLTAVNGKFEKCRAVFTPTPPVALPPITTTPVLTHLPPETTTPVVTKVPPVVTTPPTGTTVPPVITVRDTPAVTPSVTPTPTVDPSAIKTSTTVTQAATPKTDPAVTPVTPKIASKIIKKDPGTTDPGTVK